MIAESIKLGLIIFVGTLSSQFAHAQMQMPMQMGGMQGGMQGGINVFGGGQPGYGMYGMNSMCSPQGIQNGSGGGNQLAQRISSLKAASESGLAALKEAFKDFPGDSENDKDNSECSDALLQYAESEDTCANFYQEKSTISKCSKLVSKNSTTRTVDKESYTGHYLNDGLCYKKHNSELNPKAVCAALEVGKQKASCEKIVAGVESFRDKNKKLNSEISKLQERESEEKEKQRLAHLDAVLKGTTEGQVCLGCQAAMIQQANPTKTQIWGAIGMDAGGIVANIFNQRYQADLAGRLGYPYYYGGGGYQYPYALASLYGNTMGGVSGGGFGCGQTMNGIGGQQGMMGMMQNPWGQPGMMNGGMFNPGFGPCMMGGCGGMNGGMMGGFQMGGMGMQMGGMPMGGMGMQMGGMPMGGMGMQMGGYPMGGMPMGGLGGMGMQMGGYPMGGMPMGGAAMGGMAYGGMGMPMGGMGAMGGVGGLGLDYQIQMMQMQQQQYQVYADLQKRYLENYQVRARNISNLQGQISLLYQNMQQEYQNLGSGMGGIGGIGGVGAIGGYNGGIPYGVGGGNFGFGFSGGFGITPGASILPGNLPSTAYPLGTNPRRQ